MCSQLPSSTGWVTVGDLRSPRLCHQCRSSVHGIALYDLHPPPLNRPLLRWRMLVSWHTHHGMPRELLGTSGAHAFGKAANAPTPLTRSFLTGDAVHALASEKRSFRERAVDAA